MTDYTPPTPAQRDVVRQRYQELGDRYYAANRAMLKLGEEYRAVAAEMIRLDSLAVPVREYLLDKFTRYSFSRKATVARLAPHHDPAEVARVLGELEAEGLIREDPHRGWVALFEGNRP